MPSFKSDAYIIGRYPLTESSWIVVLFTRELGLVRAVAKGGKQVKSPFRGSLEPMGLSSVHVYCKEGRDLGTIRSADETESPLELFSDWGRSAVLFGLQEVLQKGLADHCPEEETFRLLGSVLKGMRAGVAPTLAWPYFLFWFLKIHGVLPDQAKLEKDIGEEGMAAVESFRKKALPELLGLEVSAAALKNISHVVYFAVAAFLGHQIAAEKQITALYGL